MIAMPGHILFFRELLFRLIQSKQKGIFPHAELLNDLQITMKFSHPSPSPHIVTIFVEIKFWNG